MAFEKISEFKQAHPAMFYAIVIAIVMIILYFICTYMGWNPFTPATPAAKPTSDQLLDQLEKSGAIQTAAETSASS